MIKRLRYEFMTQHVIGNVHIKSRLLDENKQMKRIQQMNFEQIVSFVGHSEVISQP